MTTNVYGGSNSAGATVTNVELSSNGKITKLECTTSKGVDVTYAGGTFTIGDGT